MVFDTCSHIDQGSLIHRLFSFDLRLVFKNKPARTPLEVAKEIIPNITISVEGRVGSEGRFALEGHKNELSYTPG